MTGSKQKPEWSTTAGLIASLRKLGAGQSDQGRPAKRGKPGCLGILALALLIGGFLALLERGGCIGTQSVLRTKTQVQVTRISLQKEKNVGWVYFKVRNDSKWPVTLTMVFEVRKTTNPRPVVSNSVEVLNVPPNSESDEHRVGFDLGVLNKAGIDDLADKDTCMVRHSIKSISEAKGPPAQP